MVVVVVGTSPLLYIQAPIVLWSRQCCCGSCEEVSEGVALRLNLTTYRFQLSRKTNELGVDLLHGLHYPVGELWCEDDPLPPRRDPSQRTTSFISMSAMEPIGPNNRFTRITTVHCCTCPTAVHKKSLNTEEA